MSGYGLTQDQADRLIAMGLDTCKFFEHACKGLDLELPPHNPNGCYLCEKVKSGS